MEYLYTFKIKVKMWLAEHENVAEYEINELQCGDY